MKTSSLTRCAQVAASFAFAAAAQAGSYTIVDLGKKIYPAQVDARGQVAVQVDRRSGILPALYRNGRLHKLCCSGNPGDAYANAINGHGDAVGQGGDQTKAVMWQHTGDRLELPLPDGAQSVQLVTGVALDGTTVGTFVPAGGGSHCFRTSPTGPAQDLGLMDHGDTCWAYAINKSGEIVGEASTARSLGQAFLWRDGTFRDLGGLPPTFESRALGINDPGAVVGFSGLHAFLWMHGDMQDLDPASIYYLTQANAIENSGVAVGYGVKDNIYRALRFDANGITELADEVVNLQDWTLTDATSINDDGTIVGFGIRADGEAHGFMLVPQP
jgi:probable HAF family extracellular repeat protein